MAHSRYSSIAIILHWAIAILILGQIAGGLYMHNLPNDAAAKFDLYQLHKSFGVSVLVLSLARLGWRLINPAPALPQAMPPWQRFVARGVHWGFYVLIIATPLVGWAMVSVSPKEIPTLWFGLANVPHLPIVETFADRAAAEELFAETHKLLALSILALLALHVAAALKHGLLDKDDVVESMAPRNGQLFGVAFIFVGLMAMSALYFTGKVKEGDAAPISAPVSAPVETGDVPSGEAGATENIAPQSEGALSHDWIVNGDKSTLKFIGEEKGRRFEGVFGSFDADIVFDPENLAASQISVVVNTASAATGDELRDSTMPGGEWFDSQSIPTANFASTSIRHIDGNSYVADGTLTVKNIDKDITLQFSVEFAGDTALAVGAVDLIRTDFELGAASAWLDEENVSLDVRVEFLINATRGS